jgi:hypothetical protein
MLNGGEDVVVFFGGDVAVVALFHGLGCGDGVGGGGGRGWRF